MKKVDVTDSITQNVHELEMYQHYYYDGMGNRVLKVGSGKLDPTVADVDPIVFHCNEHIAETGCAPCQEDLNVRGYYYGREAGGKVLATYETSPEGVTGMLSSCYAAYYYLDLKEWYIYGSESDGRISVLKPYANEFTDHLRKNAIHSFDQAEPLAMKDTIIEYQANTIGSFTSNARITGHKEYEIKDHLGNVRAVISDVKNPENITSSISSWTFTAEIRNLNNYFPYGMELPCGAYASIGNYGYGYNGMEKDDELKGSGKTYTTLFREGDTENGRWWSRDPMEMSMPYQSPYILMSGNPIARIDPNGDADYYNEEGKKVASVNPSDESSYILNNNDDIEKAKSGDVSNLSDQVEKIPSKEVRDAIKAAEDRSNKPTKIGGKYNPKIADDKGGFHEEAVSWGKDSQTGEELIMNAKPGDYVNLLTNTEAIITSLSPGSDEDMEKLKRIGSSENMVGKAHIHSAGTINDSGGLYFFEQPPSGGKKGDDVDNVKENPHMQHIVISASTNKVYFYGTKEQNKVGKTYKTEFPKDVFYNIK